MTISAIQLRGIALPAAQAVNFRQSVTAIASAPDSFTLSAKSKSLRFSGLAADTLTAQKEAHVVHLLNNQLKPMFNTFSVEQVYREATGNVALAVKLGVKTPGDKADTPLKTFEFKACILGAEATSEASPPPNTILYQLHHAPELIKYSGSDDKTGYETRVTYELTPEGKPIIRYQKLNVEQKYGGNRQVTLAKELISETVETTANAKAFFEGLEAATRQQVAEKANELVYEVADLTL